MQRFARAIALLAAMAMLSTFALAPQASAQEQTIAEIAAGSADLTTLVTALEAASAAGGGINFIEAVSNPGGDFTVFAPTNAAFAALGASLDAALADPGGLLTEILAFHVVSGGATGADLVAAGGVATLAGESVTIEARADGNVYVNGAQVVVADIQASNGVVHIIDAVLLPGADPAPEEPAPEEPAPEEPAPEEPAPEAPAEDPAPEAESGAAAAPAPAPAAAAGTIGEIAIATPELSTLVTAVQLASAEGSTNFLAAITDPNASLTVFAPTDAAFTALGATLDAALADPAGLLSEVLSYHILGTAKSRVSLSTQGTAITAQGQSITIAASNGQYQVNGANFVIADIAASNGVVHVIDAVLVPELAPATPNQPGTFSGPTASADSVAMAGPSNAQSGSYAAPNATAATTDSAAMPLANTGQESMPMFLIAAGLVMLGALVLLTRDRYELAVVTNRNESSKRNLDSFSWPSAPKMPDHSTFSDAYEDARND